MPIPALNEFGLLPAGVHICAVADIENAFCENKVRKEIWDAFDGFLNWVATMPGPVALLVDGSFVTDKAAPSDVDVVVDITECSHHDQNAWFGAFHRDHEGIKAQFRTDFYPTIVGQGSDFTAFFQYIRVEDALMRGAPDDTRKGILRLAQ